MWLRFMLGLGGLYAVFEASARALDSDRGQAGVLVAIVVILSSVGVDHWLLGEPVKGELRRLGLGLPDRRGLFGALIPCLLLLLVIPLYFHLSKASWSLYPGWARLLVGLFAQAGIAEEVLFRGFLFRHLRQGRSFLGAAMVASVPFVLVHLSLFLTMPWPIATASVLLAVLISFPLACLFESGGNTIWGPALVHWVVQGVVKIIVVEGGGVGFPVLWMLASAVIPFVVFAYRPRGPGSHIRGPARRHYLPANEAPEHTTSHDTRPR